MAVECFDGPVKVKESIIDIIDVEVEITYRKVVSTVWVDVGGAELVPHHYGAWYAWFDDDWVGSLRGFIGP